MVPRQLVRHHRHRDGSCIPRERRCFTGCTVCGKPGKCKKKSGAITGTVPLADSSSGSVCGFPVAARSHARPNTARSRIRQTLSRLAIGLPRQAATRALWLRKWEAKLTPQSALPHFLSSGRVPISLFRGDALRCLLYTVLYSFYSIFICTVAKIRATCYTKRRQLQK